MLIRCVSRCTHLSYIRRSYLGRRHLTLEAQSADKTRNIGIIAHIDAGKTTTTERMLYYAGYTRQIGDVDEGSTITDFLPAERARGITIQSAAITFAWPPSSNPVSKEASETPRSTTSHNINLIDTPGHADFTFEVLRSLRVLDGAVCILDSVAGVEAQTEKVWSQASAYQIPRLIFVNKLDRDGASFQKTVQQIGTKLKIWPALCMIPWWNEQGALKGVADVVNMRTLGYAPGGDGKTIEVTAYDQLLHKDETFAKTLGEARTALVELLAEHDDEMVEVFLDSDENHLQVSAHNIRESLRRCTLSWPQRVTPVFAGASFRNVGVQPLLDGVVDLLPSPVERPDAEVSAGGGSKHTMTAFLQPLKSAQSKTPSKTKAALAAQTLEACALAFKVVNDARRGVLVYVRVYTGRISRNTLLWNTNLQVSERAQRLLKMYANDAVDIESIETGQIGVIPGLKFARTGDSLIATQNLNPKTGPSPLISQLQLRPIVVPPPVFFVSIEPNSLAEERHVKEALELLLREDPSLNVRVDEESGQTQLAGMGELHLEIAKNRLVQDLKAKARVGNIEISYREAVTTSSADVVEIYDRDIGGKSSKAGCIASVEPRSDSTTGTTTLLDDNSLEISLQGLNDEISEDRSVVLTGSVIKQALQNGVQAALARGPTYGFPMHSTCVHIKVNAADHIFQNTTATALSSVARSAVQRAMRDSVSKQEAALMEPVMSVSITVDEPSLGQVVQDISAVRGGSVLALDADELDDHSDTKIDVKRIYTPPDPFGFNTNLEDMSNQSTSIRTVIARVPLKEMVGYLKHLRSMTGGRGTFTMTVDRFERMASQRVKLMMAGLAGEDY